MKKLLITLILCFPSLLFAQGSPGRSGDPGRSPWVPKANGVLTGKLQFRGYANGSEPSNPRTGDVIWSTTDSKLRWYNGSSWETVGAAGGAVGFDAITGGTNVSAAMIVGTGSSLTYSGSGTINASTLIGATWAAPAAIGTGTAAAGNFTSLTASGADPQIVVTSSGVGIGSRIQLADSAETKFTVGYENDGNDLFSVYSNAGSRYRLVIDDTNGFVAVGNTTSPGAMLDIEETTATSGTPHAFLLVSGTHTGMTASTEAIGVDFDLDATKTWATGAIATQREVVVRRPTYAFAGSSTITTAATFAITGAPVAGTNATITNTYALDVESGDSLFGGSIFSTVVSAPILQNTSGGTGPQFLRLTSSGADTYWGNESSGAGAFFSDSLAYSSVWYTSTAQQFIIAGTSRMIITATGDVGIGTKTPTAGLQMGNDKLIARDVNAGLTASTTQSQGQGALTAEINEVSTVANANDTVTLITATAGICQHVYNNGANTLQIFPAADDNLGAGVDTATTLAAGSNVTFCAYDSTHWEID